MNHLFVGYDTIYSCEECARYREEYNSIYSEAIKYKFYRFFLYHTDDEKTICIITYFNTNNYDWTYNNNDLLEKTFIIKKKTCKCSSINIY